MMLQTKLSVFDTDPDLYAELRRVFPEQTSEMFAWVSLTTTTGVEMTFFARPATDEPTDEIEEDEAA